MAHTKESRKRELTKRKAVRTYWLKTHGPCAICGSNKKLELDHVDPRTKISHNIWSWNEKRRAVELNKCQVLCYICHKEKTKLEKKEMFTVPLEKKTHGRLHTYRCGCRCLACKKARSASYYRNK